MTAIESFFQACPTPLEFIMLIISLLGISFLGYLISIPLYNKNQPFRSVLDTSLLVLSIVGMFMSTYIFHFEKDFSVHRVLSAFCFVLMFLAVLLRYVSFQKGQSSKIPDLIIIIAGIIFILQRFI